MGENENLNDAKRKCMVMELEKGKETAIRLQKLMMDPVQDLEHVLFDELALQITSSFNLTLSMLSPLPGLSESTQIGGDGSICSGESTRRKKTVVNDRRGCYKRRKTSDSWVTVLPTLEDGHAWRKYGQKKIQNSQHHRCYYRCTHKSQGCKAQKQVQKHKEDPFMYHTTYFHHHTCKETSMAPLLIADQADPMDKNLLSFNVGTKLNTPKNIPPPIMKQESHSHTLLISKRDHISDCFEAKSSKMDPWVDILNDPGSDIWLVGQKPMWSEYQEVVGSSLQSCGSTSFGELDMEVNQLDDIEKIKCSFI